MNFRDYCIENLGAVPLAELDTDGMSPEGRDEIVRCLYETYRRAPACELTVERSWRGWLDCSPTTQNGKLLGELLDFEADKTAQYAESEDLKRLDLTTILGIREPRLRLLVRPRGSRWLLKFVELGVARGHGRKREDLPQLGNTAAESPRGASAPASEGGNAAPDANAEETLI